VNTAMSAHWARKNIFSKSRGRQRGKCEREKCETVQKGRLKAKKEEPGAWDEVKTSQGPYQKAAGMARAQKRERMAEKLRKP